MEGSATSTWAPTWWRSPRDPQRSPNSAWCTRPTSCSSPPVQHGRRGSLDGDTYATSGSWDSACLAAGAGLVAIEALRARGTGVAFVAARPPGHHALSDQAMGFCLINNVAVAAAALTAVGERVAIVDWDVHHGNGTQALFWDDPASCTSRPTSGPATRAPAGPPRSAGPGGQGLSTSTCRSPVPPATWSDWPSNGWSVRWSNPRPDVGPRLRRIRRPPRRPVGRPGPHGGGLRRAGPVHVGYAPRARAPGPLPRG